MSLQGAGFDTIASRYDALWSETSVGRAQRSAVWNRIDRLFQRGDFVIDLGCGTGLDAVHLQSRGVTVYGIDSSAEMVAITRKRGVDADCCPIEQLQYFDLRVDGVISNFGAMNCLTSLTSFAGSLRRMVRPGGYVALCFLNRVCVWEIAYYLFHGTPRKAFRRLGGSADSSLAKAWYPSGSEIASAFKKDFRLIDSTGIGLSVPPSYVKSLSARHIDRCFLFDQWLADKPVLRALADHRLYVFRRK